jgi:hypothetical protein
MTEINKALTEFQSAYKQVKFDATVKVRMKTGGEYSFEYATLAHITETCRPIWVKHGLSLIQTFNGPNLVTRLGHTSGEVIESSIPLRMDGSNQEQGAEISYKRRYAIACILGVVADEDDDSNSAAGNDFQKSNTAKSKEPVKDKNAGLPWDDINPPAVSGKPSMQYVLGEGKIKQAKDLTDLKRVWGEITVGKKDLMAGEYLKLTAIKDERKDQLKEVDVA